MGGGGDVSDLKGKLTTIFNKKTSHLNFVVVLFVSCVVLGPIWRDLVEFQLQRFLSLYMNWLNVPSADYFQFVGIAQVVSLIDAPSM